jgi:hypothetical protein
MEVHHHPELPHGESKHFKEYILEFLMIFLAVTMGFIAENIREHLSDSSKESEYITGMIKDLKVDTASLNSIISKGHEQLKGIDTLRHVSKERLSEIKVQDSLYFYTTKYLFALNPFKSDDITMIQLRNAGGYRLIRKEGAVDSIALYESKINVIEIQQSFLSAGVTRALDAANLVFDFNAFDKFKSKQSSTPILITYDKEKINGFYNQGWMMSIILKNYNNMLEGHLKYCTRLIAYLKKTYKVD